MAKSAEDLEIEAYLRANPVPLYKKFNDTVPVQRSRRAPLGGWYLEWWQYIAEDDEPLDLDSWKWN